MATLSLIEWALLVAVIGVTSGWLAAYILRGVFKIAKAVKLLFGLIPAGITLGVYIVIVRETDHTFSVYVWSIASLLVSLITLYLLGIYHLIPGVTKRTKEEERTSKKQDGK